MEITTPALLFPAISLLFVAYTSRLHSLSVLIRAMTTDGSNESKTMHAKEQLNILKKRVNYIKKILEKNYFFLILFVLKVVSLSISSRRKVMKFLILSSFGRTSNSSAFTLLFVLSISTRSFFIPVSNSATLTI